MSEVSIKLPKSAWESLLTVITWTETQHNDDVDVSTELSSLQEMIQEQLKNS